MCQSCDAFVRTEIPASRDCCTTSIHVLRHASVEIVIDLGITDADSTIARMFGLGLPADTSRTMAMRMYDCSRLCGSASIAISVMTRVAL